MREPGIIAFAGRGSMARAPVQDFLRQGFSDDRGPGSGPPSHRGWLTAARSPANIRPSTKSRGNDGNPH